MGKTSGKLGQIRAWYKNNLWQGRLLFTALILFLVLVIVRVSLPFTIVYSAVYWLDKQGITSQIDDISINVIQGTFSILNASGTKNGDTVFNIDKASIDWAWAPLSTKTIVVKQVVLEDLDLQAQQYSDGLIIAGITIRSDGTVEQPPAAEEQPVAWSTALNQVDFRDLNVCFQQYTSTLDQATRSNAIIDYCAQTDLFRWQGSISLGNDKSAEHAQGLSITVEGELQLQQFSLLNNSLNAELINLADLALSNIRVTGINDIQLDSINASDLHLLQRTGHSSHKHAVEVQQINISDISFNNSDTLVIDSISVSQPRLSMAKDNSGAWKYEQWIPASATHSEKITEKTPESANDNVAFKFNLGSINISDTELCYEQPAIKSGRLSQPIDYCVNVANTGWMGDISITTPVNTQPLVLVLAGDLNIDKFSSTNNALQRDLLSFEKLAINKIDISAVDNLAFAKLSLDKANGLELTSARDKHTISVSSVDIVSFSFANNTLAIDKLAINDLGLEVTQNTDGSFDFDKWKINSSEAQPAEETVSDKPATDPVKIKLGEFTLDTTRIVEFTDLSVTPTMHTGFKELHVSAKNLDSEKPDQDSPISLSAKTTRHGTIDISGVARPFESKPSFDATGKITGLDLRAASPKAEQTIGHIIKSGQLDADLKLFADKGQLDSNIGLVLHHFNLKAKSKEDAAELDGMFGMPINQSLVLLKDKKGRIKLDIPITGDINNPDFDPTDAIIKATAKATSVTLITFYTPYGLAYAGGNVLFNIATAMNFDPLLFDPGSSELTGPHKEQLGKLAELLTERPAVHLTLCGFTNLNDRDKLFTEILDKDKVKPPSAERLQKLKQLGSKRQDNVKNYLVSAGKIEHSRLILCEPEHSDDAEAIAGVEISI
jgi:hypothetical protein